jgi:hypothetical protein
MRRILTRVVLALAACALPLALSPTAAESQVPTTVAASDTVWEIRLADGSTLVGQVVTAAADRFTIRTGTGVTVELERGQISRMTVARGTIREGVLWAEDPNRTRLFFGPTGRMLERGEGYFSVFELFLPFVSYAVTDHVTIAGGTPVVPQVIGRIWYVAPKVGLRLRERTHLSGGVLAFFNTARDEFDDFGSAGIFYGVATQGTEDAAATLGVGWGFAGSEVENRPVFMFGAESRTGPRVKLLTENYLVTYRESTRTGETTRVAAMLSGGVRFFGERLSADAGVGVAFGGGETACCLPLVNFVYNFGGGR